MKFVSTFSLLILLLGNILVFNVAPGIAAESKRPNVILIVSDDLGYGDLGFQGGKDFKTPHLDALARGGVRFTNAYVTGPLCGPTRAGLLSGRYQQSHSYDSNPGPQQGLNLNEVTLADAFKSAGYKTGAIGKWHLGQLPEYLPLKRGFDEYFGFYGAMHSYIPGPVADSARMVGERPRNPQNADASNRPQRTGGGAGFPVGIAWVRLIDEAVSSLEVTPAEKTQLAEHLAAEKEKLTSYLQSELGNGIPDPQKVRELVLKRLPDLYQSLENKLSAEQLAKFKATLDKGPQAAGGAGFGNIIGSQPGKLIRQDQEVDEPRYLTEAFGDEALSFVERHRESPFFLYLSFNASHSPLQPPQSYLDRFPGLTGKRQAYAATTAALDDSIGRLIAKLRELQLEENTLIYYTNDNGGPTQDIAADNQPLGGVKGSLWEGGIRVPSFVYWKGQIEANQERHHPVTSLDIYPTVLAAAGIKTDKPLDGQNLLPSLKGQVDEQLNQRTIYWRFNNLFAIRRGKWKLTKPERNEEPQLFDLEADVAETSDLSKKHPDIVASLQTQWNEWNQKNLPLPATSRP